MVSVNAVRVILTCLAAVLLLPGRALGQAVHRATGSEVVVTPATDPKRVADRLASLPSGSRVLAFSGFDYDLTLRDRVSLPASPASRGGAAAVVVPSPWVSAGAAAVQGRVANWLRRLGPGAVIDSIAVTAPSKAAHASLARATSPYISRLSADRRFPSLLARHPALNAAIRTGPVGAAREWTSVVESEMKAASMTAHVRAVRVVRPGTPVALLVPADPASAVPSAAPASTAVTSAPPSVALAQSTASPSAAAAGQGSPAAADPHAELTSRSVTDATVALANVAGGRRLSPWNGDFLSRPTIWTELLAAARTDPDVRRCILGMEDAARAAVVADRAWYVRPESFDQINPMLIDARCYAAGSNKDVFALAMSDIGQAHFVRSSGVPLALLAVYTSKPEYLDRALDILSEMRGHRPLQRPGWTAYLPTAQLAAGGDGVFLATSWGLGGIIDMLAILGDRVPAGMRSDLESLIREEVSRIAADWAVERPWYVKSRTVQSNQWIEPSIALARACLFLNDRRLDAAYNLATENLASSLATFGEDGAFAEGLTYASMTVGPMFDVLAEMARGGDMRCHEYPYVRNSWKWFLHMHMPGGRYVNCFDSRMGFVPAWALRTPLPSLISAAMGSGDPLAVGRLRSFFPVGDASLSAVRYQAAIGAAGAAPAALGEFPTYAHFPSQALVVWRSLWEAPSEQQTAMGVWVRGGSVTDSHSHRDQGHVSVYWGSRPILIEAGTPAYSDPDMETKYASAAGHGIMQVSELRPRGRAVAAPLSIARLDSEGGRVSVDTSAAYVAPVQSCSRSVEWDRSGVVEISDAVTFATHRPAETEIYRLHLGARTAVEVSSGPNGWTVAWPGTVIEIRASESINLRQQMWPDADAPGSEHVVLSIVGAVPIQSLQLATKVTVQPDP